MRERRAERTGRMSMESRESVSETGGPWIGEVVMLTAEVAREK